MRPEIPAFFARTNSTTQPEVDLSQFDGYRVAVILQCPQRDIICRGVAQYSRDNTVGNVLRINFDDSEPGRPSLLIEESRWKGRIIPDLQHGCDYCLIPARD